MAITGTIAAAVAVGGSVLQYREARKQRKQQAEIIRQQDKQRQLESIRARAEAARRARVARAQIQNAAATTGTASSSGAQGGAASVGSQLATNLSFLDRTNQIQTNIFNAQNNILQSQGRSALFGVFTQLGTTIASSGFSAGGTAGASAASAGAGRHAPINTARTGALSPTFGL